MHSTGYIIRFTLILTVVAALVLSGMFYATEPAAKRNEAVFNKRSVLASIEKSLPTPISKMSDQEVLDIFSSKIEQVSLDAKGTPLDGIQAEKINMEQEMKKDISERQLPMYIFNGDQGKLYIMAVRGNGLWDRIWGYVAIKDDLNTIAGVSFDHKAETPGLGAEIKDDPSFPAQFKDKTIFDATGKFTSVKVMKAGVKNPSFEVDGIGGATLTCDGVTDMMYDGIELYLPYLKSLKK